MNINPKFKNEVHRRLAKWARGKPQAPVLIDLEPVAICNLKCKFCWQRDDYRLKITNYSQPLTEKRILDLIHEAGRTGVKEWNVAGGWEPTIRPELCRKIMNLIKDYGMYGCLTTSGVNFNEDWVREAVEMGWDRILFSLNGPDAKTHDSLTQVPGSFKRITRAMSQFKGYKEQFGRDGPDYSCHSVLCTENYTKVREMIELAHKLGASGMSWEPMNPWSDIARTILLSDKQRSEFQKYIQPALETSWYLNIGTNLERFREMELIDKEHMDEVLKDDVDAVDTEQGTDDPFLTSPCYAPWLSLEIRASGHVVPCRLCDYQDEAPLIHHQSLKSLWNGTYFGKIRERFKQGKLMPYCNTCASGFVVGFRQIREEIQRQNNVLYRVKNAIFTGR